MNNVNTFLEFFMEIVNFFREKWTIFATIRQNQQKAL